MWAGLEKLPKAKLMKNIRLKAKNFEISRVSKPWKVLAKVRSELNCPSSWEKVVSIRRRISKEKFRGNFSYRYGQS